MFDGKNIVSGELVVDMTTIVDTDIQELDFNKKLVNHLLSQDFFYVSKFPLAKFKLNSAKKISEGKFQAHGDLTIKGKTHPTQINVEISIQGVTAKIQGQLNIDRTMYNIKYGSGKFFQNLGDKLIDDTFEINFNLKAKSGK